MVLLHIAIALGSLGFSTFLYFFPSKARLRVSYCLVGLTVASGTYLIVASQAAMLRTCMMGLLYVGATSAVIVAAHRKLALQEIDKSRN